MVALVLNKSNMRIAAGFQIECNSKWIKSRGFDNKLCCCRKVALMRRWLSNLIVLLVHISNRMASLMVCMRFEKMCILLVFIMRKWKSLRPCDSVFVEPNRRLSWSALHFDVNRNLDMCVNGAGVLRQCSGMWMPCREKHYNIFWWTLWPLGIKTNSTL